MRYDRYWRTWGALAGWISIAVGTVQGIAWILEPVGLARAMPIIFAMQFNSALCFVLTGIAFNLSVVGSRRSRIAMVLSSLAALVALVALVESVLSSDIGMDRLFVEPFITYGTTSPGRIVPNTALCFLLVNAGIIMTGIARRNSRARILVGFLVFMIAASALLGYVFGIGAAHNWLPLAQMSPQTAFCFTTLATGMIFIGAHKLGYHRSTLAATVLAGTYLLLIFLAYIELLRQGEGAAAPLTAGGEALRLTLFGVVLLSGAVFAGLIIYAFRSSQKYRAVALKLQESQKRLAAIIETAIDGFITIDSKGIILAVNPACERIFGYRAEELMSRNVSMLMPAAHANAHDQYLSAYHATGRARIIGIGRELEGRRKDGSVFPMDLSVAKVSLDTQVLYSGIVRDISERKRYERELLEANAELEEFSYRTSHDLRSPIASSLGLLSIVREVVAAGDTQAVEPIFQRIETSILKLDSLIQNIIQLTRVKSLEEEPVPIDIGQMVQDCIDRMRFLDRSGHLTIDVDIPDKLIIIKKESRVQIIVDNLVSNAFKYQDPANREQRIGIHSGLRNGVFEFSVSDNGLGVEPGKENQLFQMFRRLHPRQSFGSGLGLYILKKSVLKLGGSVDYVRLEKGSLFKVLIPESDDHDDEIHPDRR